MKVTWNLPDDIAQRARDAGLLTQTAIEKLLEAEIRRTAGRSLLTMAERLHAAGITPLSAEALDDLIHASRADRKRHSAGGA